MSVSPGIQFRHKSNKQSNYANFQNNRKNWFADFGGVQLTECQLYKCKCGWIRGWRSFCSPYRYLSLITAFCPTRGQQVLFFPLLLGLRTVPSSSVWCLGCHAPPLQPSPSASPPISLPPLLLAHAGADNKGVHRGISVAASAQRGARSCERSTHAEVTHSVVTRRVAGEAAHRRPLSGSKLGQHRWPWGPVTAPARHPAWVLSLQKGG